MKTLIFLLLALLACEVSEHEHPFLIHDHPVGDHEHPLIAHKHDLPGHSHEFAVDRTHDVQHQTTGDAMIVSIDPAVAEDAPPFGPNSVIPDNVNVGMLEQTGWQQITITFSERPANLNLNVSILPDPSLGKWFLQGRVLTINLFCDNLAWPDHLYPLEIHWNSGYILLNYFCPPK